MLRHGPSLPSFIRDSVKKMWGGAVELAQWLKALAVLLEDPSSPPSTHMVAYNHPYITPFLWILSSLLTSMGARHAYGSQTCAGKTSIYIKWKQINLFFLKKKAWCDSLQTHKPLHYEPHDFVLCFLKFKREKEKRWYGQFDEKGCETECYISV